MNAAVSRRGFFSAFARPFQRQTPHYPAVQEKAAEETKTAVIQGRYCLALTSFCSVCVERCPVPGAIRSERGLPMITADVCTGCGICHDVCPAPRNAVLLLPRRTLSPATSAS